MWRIGGLLILAITIITIVDIVRSNRDNEKKILWILGVFFFPIIGSIAWFLVSRNSFR